MTSRLEVSPNSTPTPTATPTATATATGTVNATPTATATGTNVAPTNTATATATTIATATSTPTPTATTVVPTATATVTGTPVAQPNLNFYITSNPSPPHPGGELTFTIHFENGTIIIVRSLKFTLRVPTFTIYIGIADQLRSAGWQCAAATAGAECTYTVGDVPVGGTGTVDFPVDVLESTPLGTKIVLNVVATDADGNTFTGGNNGVTHEDETEVVNYYLPFISKD